MNRPNLKRLKCDFRYSKYPPLLHFQTFNTTISNLCLCKVYDIRDVHLSAIGKHLKQLEIIQVRSEYVTDEGIQCFLSLAKNLQKFVLQCRYNIVGDHWIPNLQFHPSLTFLDVHKCLFISPNNLELLKSNIGNMKIVARTSGALRRCYVRVHHQS